MKTLMEDLPLENYIVMKWNKDNFEPEPNKPYTYEDDRSKPRSAIHKG